MDEFEPYAAPANDAAEPPEAPVKGAQAKESERAVQLPSDLAKSHAEAIKRLNEHLANPEMAALDRAARGARFRSSTLSVTGTAVILAAISFI